MSGRADVKPLARWAIQAGCTLRFSRRAADGVEGVATGAQGEQRFRYDPATSALELAPSEECATPGATRVLQLNEYGWEQPAG